LCVCVWAYMCTCVCVCVCVCINIKKFTCTTPIQAGKDRGGTVLVLNLIHKKLICGRHNNVSAIQISIWAIIHSYTCMFSLRFPEWLYAYIWTVFTTVHSPLSSNYVQWDNSTACPKLMKPFNIILLHATLH